VALKMSVQYWRNRGKPRKCSFICLDHGYHGDTVGTMSVSGVDLFTRPFEKLTFPSVRVGSPYCYRCSLGKRPDSCGTECALFLRKALQKHARKTAAIIIEPMLLGAGGMLVYPAAYLKKAALMAREFGAHLICDEVATGFGRTGKMFACEHAGISPDFLCLSKGITGGYLPLAATLASGNIAAAFRGDYVEKKTFFHGHTYTANPLACAAGIASLDVFKEEKTLAHARKLEPLFRSRLREFLDMPHVGDARSIGLVGALELVKDKKTKKGFAFEERIGYRIYLAGLRHGIMMRPLGNVIYFFLPLCVSGREIEDMFDRLRATLRHCEEYACSSTPSYSK
jgi:adenosylmethionine-8-amino-7-oxononanoate aminotransferase